MCMYMYLRQYLYLRTLHLSTATGVTTPCSSLENDMIWPHCIRMVEVTGQEVCVFYGYAHFSCRKREHLCRNTITTASVLCTQVLSIANNTGGGLAVYYRYHFLQIIRGLLNSVLCMIRIRYYLIHII